MKTEDAITFFGSQAELARTLDINESNITRWKDAGVVPIKSALKLVDLTKGELALRLRDY